MVFIVLDARRVLVATVGTRHQRHWVQITSQIQTLHHFETKGGAMEYIENPA